MDKIETKTTDGKRLDAEVVLGQFGGMINELEYTFIHHSAKTHIIKYLNRHMSQSVHPVSFFVHLWQSDRVMVYELKKLQCPLLEY